MANVSRTGFRPVKHLTGAPYNGQANIYEASSAEAIPIFVGDLVVLDGDPPTSCYPTVSAPVAAAATSGLYVGVVVGIYPSGFDPVSGALKNGRTPNLDTPNYRPASTKQFLLVADDPTLVFEGQADGALTLDGSIGKNFGVVEGTGAATLGSTTTGTSGMEIDASSANTTNTLQLHCVGVPNRLDNEVNASYNKLLFRINTHAHSVTTGATSV